MSATAAAVLKKLAVYVSTDKKALKIVGGIVLGIIIIIITPAVVVVSIFQGEVNIDTDRLGELVMETLESEDQEKLQHMDEFLSDLESKMEAAGHGDRYHEAETLYLLLLDDAGEDGFADKLVSCFSEDQSDEQLIAAVNEAFGTELLVEDFTNVMSGIRELSADTFDHS